MQEFYQTFVILKSKEVSFPRLRSKKSFFWPILVINFVHFLSAIRQYFWVLSGWLVFFFIECLISNAFFYCFKISILQGWEFAHLFSEQINRFLPKSEQMSASLKKVSNSLICSYLVSNLSDSLTIAHFLWVTWGDHSQSLIFGDEEKRNCNK